MKILITSRSHFFRSQREAVLALAGELSIGTGLSDVEEYEIWLERHTFDLQLFEPEQVREYLEKAFSNNSAAYFEKIIRIYDLANLSQRPILLALIAKVLPSLDEKSIITQDSIYDMTVRLWLEREMWRGLDTGAVLTLMEDLASKLFLEKRTQINFRDLAEEIQHAFSRKILSRMDVEYFDALVRTSGFLFRDASGNFSFMHRSFLEYVFAKTLQKRIEAGQLLVVEDETDRKSVV